MSSHTSRSPSGYHRWAVCLGSAEAEEGRPDQTSVWAAQGSLFHLLIACMLEEGRGDAQEFLGLRLTIDGHGVQCDGEMVRHLDDGFAFIQGIRPPGSILQIELNSPLDPWCPGERGTADVIIIEPGKRLTIVDWKYGSIPVVEPEQFMLYGLGAWQHQWLGERLEEFRFICRQPRIDSGGKEWTFTEEELLLFAETTRELHAQSLQKGNPRTPGVKQCRWCKARSDCKERHEFAATLVESRFLSSPERPLTPERRSYILKQRPLIEAWFEELRQQALQDGLAGREVPGFKVIEGRRGARQWIDPSAAEKELESLLQADAFVVTLISPTAAESKLTKAEYNRRISPLVTQAKGKPVLVDESEPGKSIETVDRKFEELYERQEAERKHRDHS